MASEIYVNDALGTVSSVGTDPQPPSPGAVETWTVNVTVAFPTISGSQQFHVCDTATGMTTEKILVTACPGGTGSQTWTVTRGAENSTPLTHAPGFTIRQVVTAGDFGAFATTATGTGLTPTAVQTANYSANAGDYVPVDTTSGSVVVTLPTTPANGTQVGVAHVTQGVTTSSTTAGYVTTPNTVTVSAGGSDVIGKPGGNTSMYLSVLGHLVEFQYLSGVWYRLSSSQTSATVLISPTGDTTGAKDTANFQAVAAARAIGQLQSGARYYVNAPTIFPPGSGLTCAGQSLQYYGGSLAQPMTGAIIVIVNGFTGTTINGQAVKAPIVMVDQYLGGYTEASAGQTFRGITIDGKDGPAPSGTDGIQAWGPVWGVHLENVGVYGCTGNGVTTNKTSFPSATTTVASTSNGGQISQIATWSSPAAGELDVGSTAGFPSPSGAFTVATSTTTATVNYTNVTATSFTGCTYYGGSATGTVSTGGLVSAGDTLHFPDLWFVYGCHFANNGGDGFNGASISDSYFLASESTGNTGNGWTVNGDNFKFVQCKAEFNTVGWLLNAGGAHQRAVQLVGCGTDSNKQHGIFIEGASQWPVILSNVGLTNDGTSDGSSGTLYAGLNVTGAAHVSVTGLHVLTEANTPANGVMFSGSGVLSLADSEIYARVTPISTSGFTGTLLTGSNVIASTGNWQGGTTTPTPQQITAPGGLLISAAGASGTFGSLLDVTNTTTGPTQAPVGLVAANAAERLLGLRVTGDTQSRLYFDSNGEAHWGPGGSTTQDTTLYRSAASTLKTDGTFNAVTAVQVNANPLGFAGIFGNGSDGAITFDGTTTPVAGATLSGSTYTMTRDIQATSVTVNGGVTAVTVKTSSSQGTFRIFCQGTVTVASNATITAAGNAASGSTAGAALASGSLVGGRAGGAGGTGVSGGGANGANASFGVAGGAGGAGTSGGFGSGGTVTFSGTIAVTNILITPVPVLAGIVGYGGSSPQIGAGAGGGGGGSDASSNAGGGGGGGGGIVAILAYAVVNNGTITAAGGAGANGTGGNAGGGGGGSGGLILIYTLSAWTAGTTNVSGGGKGLKATGGTGSDGNNGGTGNVLNVVVQ